MARTAEVVFNAQWNHMLALLVFRAALSCLLFCCLASLLLWFFRYICGNPAFSSANGSAVLLLWLSLKQGFPWAILNVDQCRCQNFWQNQLPLLVLFFFAVVDLASWIRPWVSVLRGGGVTALTLSWCFAVLPDRMGLKYGPWWLHHHGRRASLQIHFAQYEIFGMTVCDSLDFPSRPFLPDYVVTRQHLESTLGACLFSSCRMVWHEERNRG